MIAKEGSPALRRAAFSWLCILQLCSGDVDPELEQFAMNPGLPTRDCHAHLENELASVRGDRWPTAAPS
jgi:hypothetical protein